MILLCEFTGQKRFRSWKLLIFVYLKNVLLLLVFFSIDTKIVFMQNKRYGIWN